MESGLRLEIAQGLGPGLQLGLEIRPVPGLEISSGLKIEIELEKLLYYYY